MSEPMQRRSPMPARKNTGPPGTPRQIGTVGHTEERAREMFRVVDIYKSSFRPLKATLSGPPERTLMKLVVDAETDKVVGAHILGPDTARWRSCCDFAETRRPQGGLRRNHRAAPHRRRGTRHHAPKSGG